MRCPSYLAKDERGLTLVEVLVSVTLLVLMSMSFAPALMFVLDTSERNRIRTTATVLANEVIEEVRAKHFDDIVIDDDNVTGNKSEERTVDGQNYLIQTWIDWRELDGSGRVGWDYKSIKVEVSPMGTRAGEGSAVSIGTIVSRDSGVPYQAAPGLRIHAYEGLDEDQGTNYTGGLEISATYVADEGNPLAGHTVTAITGSAGTALFPALDVGEYTVEPINIPDKMVAKPGSYPVSTFIDESSGDDIMFFLVKASKLTVAIKDSDGNALSIKGTITLWGPFIGNDGVMPSVERRMENSSTESFAGLWPAPTNSDSAYNLVIDTDNGSYYYNLLEDSSKPWDGKINNAGSSLEINVKLWKNEEIERS